MKQSAAASRRGQLAQGIRMFWRNRPAGRPAVQPTVASEESHWGIEGFATKTKSPRVDRSAEGVAMESPESSLAYFPDSLLCPRIGFSTQICV